MQRFRLALVFSFCLAFGVLAPAQIAPPAITLGRAIVALNGPWKFHIGDNPQWANPRYDDSSWETVDLTPKPGSYNPNTGFYGYVPGWTAKGHPGYWGYAWYRIRVRVAAPTDEPLALSGPMDMDDAYELFANGMRLGSFGKFRGKRPVVYNSQPEMFRLPQSQDGAAAGSSAIPETLVLAFRVWMEPSTLTFEPDAGGFHSPPFLGAESAIAAHHRLGWLKVVRAYASAPLVAALFLLLALLACSLILFDRSDPVYLWLAGVFLLAAAQSIALAVGAWAQVESGIALSIIEDVFLRPAVLGGWVMVWWVWFRLHRPAWIPKAIAVLAVLDAISTALGEHIFLSVPHPIDIACHLASVGIRLLFLLLLVLIVAWGIRRQGREGWLALPAVLLVGIAQFQEELNVLHVRSFWFPFGAQVTLAQIAYIALAAVIFVLLLRRLRLSVEHQRELALDVKQAQEVQHLLIPEQLPQVPGLTIESEYRPAREVGGDFFQILPHPADGSVLIVLGDVTGHGLQAGMLVALIVGAIRTATETSFDPLEILQSLNRRLCGRGQAHATCLALRVAADGVSTVANAGHLAPWLNGKELPMEGALPLGMIESAEFSLMKFHLRENDRLILMSDGVVEAQDEHGHLFGFDRVADLLRQPTTAAQLTTAAQNFGQQDDLLVLRILRTARPAAPIAEPVPAGM